MLPSFLLWCGWVPISSEDASLLSHIQSYAVFCISSSVVPWKLLPHRYPLRFRQELEFDSGREPKHPLLQRIGFCPGRSDIKSACRDGVVRRAACWEHDITFPAKANIRGRAGRAGRSCSRVCVLPVRSRVRGRSRLRMEELEVDAALGALVPSGATQPEEGQPLRCGMGWNGGRPTGAVWSALRSPSQVHEGSGSVAKEGSVGEAWIVRIYPIWNLDSRWDNWIGIQRGRISKDEDCPLTGQEHPMGLAALPSIPST